MLKKTLLGFITAFCLISIFSCSEETEQEEIIRPVRYQQVFSTGGSRVRIFSGSAQAGAQSRLSFKIAGTISQVHVKIGDKVLYSKYGGTELEYENENYLIMSESDILAILK